MTRNPVGKQRKLSRTKLKKYTKTYTHTISKCMLIYHVKQHIIK